MNGVGGTQCQLQLSWVFLIVMVVQKHTDVPYDTGLPLSTTEGAFGSRKLGNCAYVTCGRARCKT